MSAYQDKVATQAKDEMAAATQVFAEASTALSSALSLQQRLIDNFYDAVPKDACKDDNAHPDQKRPRALQGLFGRLHQLCTRTTTCWRGRRRSISTGRAT